MPKIGALPDSINSKSAFARKVDDARDFLVNMAAQEQSIKDSIRESHRAIQESRALLTVPYDNGRW